ncbi:MAG: type 1 glutamine amidotransferase domain-containing protein [bacterium]|nr:type 1 glutamine amidotransferase domain-containing protein [bacterium]
MPRLLFLVSSAREMELANGNMHETGYFADEALTPFERFVEAGVEVLVATPDGRSPYADPYGLEEIFHYPDDDEDFLNSITRTFAHDVDDIRLTLHHLTELGMISARRVFGLLKEAGMHPMEARKLISRAAAHSWRNDNQFLDSLEAEDLPESVVRDDLETALAEVIAESNDEAQRVKDALDAISGFLTPTNLSTMTDEEIAEFDAVFVPGGHGPMVDMADNPDVTRVITILHEKQAAIASVCHGPAFLLSAPANMDGQWLFDGYRVTSFTDEEEDQTRPGQHGLSWYLESALRNAGAVFDDGRNAWASHVVVDRNLITAQNPGSADAVADAVLKSLEVL